MTQGGIYPLISTSAAVKPRPATPAPGTSLAIPSVYAVAIDSSGNVYFAVPNLNTVFKADPTGIVARIAGTGVWGFSGDGGLALNAQFNSPYGVAVDASGNVYIADNGFNCVRKISTSGIITAVAGPGTTGTPASAVTAARPPRRF